MTQDRGSWLSTATGLFFSWAALSFGVRIWIKLGRNQSWGHDDSTVAIAFVVTVLHIASNFVAINNGYGRALDDIDRMGWVEGSLYASQLTYIIAAGLTKIATAFFIARLTRYRPQVRMAYILGAASTVWILASVLVVALRGDLAHPWDVLDGSNALYYRWIGVEATGLAIELALWVLSVTLIWGLQMGLDKRIMILLAFGVRLLLIPLVALRLVYLSPSKNDNPTVTSMIQGILTEACLEYSLLSTSITALKPFLRPLHASAIVNSVGGANSLPYGRSQTRSQGIYMLSSVSGKDKKDNYEGGSIVEAKSVGAGGKQVKPPKPAYHRDAGASAASGNNHSTSVKGEPYRGEDASARSSSEEQMIIRTTQNWSVWYEDK